MISAPTTEISDLFKKGSSIKSTHKIMCEWNQNAYTAVSYIGSYPISILATSSDPTYAKSFNVDSVAGGWDNGGSFKNLSSISGQYQMEEDKERKKLCPITSIVKPERPDPGIVMAIPFSQSETAATGNISTDAKSSGPIINKNSNITNSSLLSAKLLQNTNRWYPASNDSKTKYWTSVRKRNYNATTSFGNDLIGVAKADKTMLGNNAFVVYSKDIITNKIVIKTQTINGYPEDFSVEVMKSGSTTWTRIFNATSSTTMNDGILRLKGSLVSGNIVWSIAEGVETEATISDLILTNIADVEQIKGIRFSAQKMSVTNATLDIIEISPRLVVDMTQYTSAFSMSTSIGDDTLGLPVGSVVSTKGRISFFNDDNLVSNKNIDSKLYGILKPNVKFTILNQITDSLNATYYVPIKVMYSNSWNENSDWSTEVELEDYMKFLNDLQAPDMLLGSTNGFYGSSVIKILLDNVGFTRFNFIKTADTARYLHEDTRMDFFYCAKEQSLSEVLNDIAKSLQFSIFFDQYGNLTAMTKEAVAQKKDSFNYWLVGDYKNLTNTDAEYASLNGNYSSNLINFEDDIISPITSGEIEYERLGIPKISSIFLNEALKADDIFSLTDGPSRDTLANPTYSEISLNRNLTYYPQEVWSIKNNEDGYLSGGILVGNMTENKPSTYLPDIDGSPIAYITGKNKNDAIRNAFNSLDPTQKKSAEIVLSEYALTTSFSQKYSGYVIIDSEIIKYNGIRYQVTRPKYAQYLEIYFSNDEKQAAVASAGANSSFIPVSLIVDLDMEIALTPDLTTTEYSFYCKSDGRGAENTTAIAHSSAISTDNNGWTEFSSALYDSAGSQTLLKPRFSLLTDTGVNKSTNTFNPFLVACGYGKLNGPITNKDALPSDTASAGVVLISNFGQKYISGVKKTFKYTPKTIGTRMCLLVDNTEDSTKTNSKIGGIGFYLSSGTSGVTGYFLEMCSIGTAYDANKDTFPSILLYKVTNVGGVITPTLLGSRYASIVPTSERIPTADEVAQQTDATVSTLNVDILINGSEITVFFEGKKLFVANDPSPLPATNQVGMFVRDDSDAIFDYIYGSPDLDSSLLLTNSPINNIPNSSDVTRLIQRKFLSDSGAKLINTAHDFEDFGNMVREARKFDVRFANPAFSTQLIELSKINPDYSIGNFKASSYGASFWAYNTSGSNVIIGTGSAFPIMISGMVLSSMSKDKIDIGSYLGETDSDERLNDTLEQNKKLYGERSINISGKYITNRKVAEDLAEWIAKNASKEKITISVDIFPNPLLQLGDIVKIFYKQKGYSINESGDKSFIIAGIDYGVQEDGIDMKLQLREML
jgi:hypothetical protein